MNQRVYEWTLRNATTGMLSFDDITLPAGGSAVVYRLTNDVLAGWQQGKLVISPDPGQAMPGLKQLMALDPCQLPLPVRVIGEHKHACETHILAEGGQVTVPSGARVMIANADRRRRLLRVRNIGTRTLWLGGKTVTNLNSLIPVEPNEVYVEEYVPCAEWYAYVAEDVAAAPGLLLVQHVYASVI